MHGTAVVVAQGGQRLTLSARLHGVQTGRKVIQRRLRGLYFRIVGPQRIAGGGDDVCRRIGPGGQFLAEVVAVVGRHAHREPLPGRVVFAAHLGTAKACKGRQHHHDAQRQGHGLPGEGGGLNWTRKFMSAA